MAEYIDREALLELINEDCKYQNPTNEYTRGCNEVCDWAIKTIKNIPTADVVPKSEVENLKVLLEMQEKAYESLKELYDMDTEVLITAREKTEIEVAREIFEEIDRYVIRGISVNGDHLTLFNGKNYAELKKKYIGESDVKRDTV